MATDVKKHTTIEAGETPSRAALAAAILSISDVIPVENATEATQVASAIAASGQNLATNPVVVARADAPGLHRIEITYDGSVWLPASGRLTFASKAEADTWGTNNGPLLSAGDECRAGQSAYKWSGTAWVPTPIRVDGGIVTSTPDIPANNYTTAWVTITFETPFTVAPVVVVTPIEGDSIQRVVASVRSVSTTQVVVTGRNVSGGIAGGAALQWIALQMTAA